MVAIGAFLLALVATCVMAAQAYAESSYARSIIAETPGRALGVLAVVASLANPGDALVTEGDDPAVAWVTGRAAVGSHVADGRLQSRSAAEVVDLSLFDGRVTVGRLKVSASTEASARLARPAIVRTLLEALCVDGVEVTPESLPVTVPGLGVVSVFERTLRRSARETEIGVVGLRVHLSEDWGTLPAGSDVLVATVACAADTRTAARLLAPAVPGESGPDVPDTATARSTSGKLADTRAAGKDVGDAAFAPGPMPAPRDIERPPVTLGPAVFPVAGRFWYCHDWHAPRAGGRRHHGCDVFARLGTPLVAVQDGTVVRLLRLSLGGISLRVVNGRGDYFYYAHLQRYAPGLREGQRVRKGQVIGYVGKTGNARRTAPHVHFEIHPRAGAAVDPFSYLELWRGATVKLHETRSPAPVQVASRDRSRRRSALPTTSSSWSATADSGGGGLPPAPVALSAVALALLALAGRRPASSPPCHPSVRPRPSREIPRHPA